MQVTGEHEKFQPSVGKDRSDGCENRGLLADPDAQFDGSGELDETEADVAKIACDVCMEFAADWVAEKHEQNKKKYLYSHASARSK